MQKLLIADLQIGESVISRGPNQGQKTIWGVVTFEGPTGVAKRITRAIAYYRAMKGQLIYGNIVKADVEPYTVPVTKDGVTENVTAVRKAVVQLEGETLEQACTAANVKLSPMHHSGAPTIVGTNIDELLATAGIPQSLAGEQIGNRTGAPEAGTRTPDSGSPQLDQ